MNSFAVSTIRIATSLVGGCILLNTIAPSAHAFNLVPQEEGEINTGVGSSLDVDGYLNFSGFSVESLDFEVSRGGQTFQTKSRLFVDQAGTANTYGGGVSFKSRDIGTSEENQAFWLRPVAMIWEKNQLLEQGQLEAGLFRFTFDSPLASLDLDFFDVESKGTSILKVNGQDYNEAIAVGGNSNISTYSLLNVSSIELMLGNANTSGVNANDRRWSTGDGVLARGTGEVATASVPEPTAMAGLFLAGAGMGLIRRKRQSV
ncbi:MAG: LEVG family PEP-CTERM protein [Leptolyngbyaceae bacterium]|nr:LEVG family PEP-CTERM protein [Leptolyngbyaceae bacterium]